MVNLYQKLNSEYYRRLIKIYGEEQADKIWNRRNNKNLNFEELGRKLSKYLYEEKGLH